MSDPAVVTRTDTGDTTPVVLQAGADLAASAAAEGPVISTTPYDDGVFYGADSSYAAVEGYTEPPVE